MAKITEEMWRDFEKLVYAIIKDTLHLDNNSISTLTQKRKDGGYDGMFIIPLGEKEIDHYTLLFEAKLRGDVKKDLPLQDFSKALIIAINMDADTLIVCTNLHLSQKSLNQLRTYTSKTGLNIKVLEGKNINEWLSQKEQNKDIVDNSLYILLRDAISGSDCSELVDIASISNHINRKDYICSLFGEKRKKQLDLAKQLLLEQKQSIIITGEAGVGKSFFSRALIAAIEDYVSIMQIDIKCCPTPRTLFLSLLEQTWNLPSEFINSMEYQNLIEAITHIGEKTVDTYTQNSVIEAFGKSTSEYSEKADIFNHYLIRYLTELYKVVSRRRPRIINITNCNSATEELLNFLIQLINSLKSSVCFVIELRTSLYIDGAMARSTWEKYVHQLKNLVQSGSILEIKSIGMTEAFTYMDSLYSEGIITDEAKKFIFEQSKSLPLFIEAFITYLNATKILKGIPNLLQLNVLKKYSINSELQIIQLAINSICEDNVFYRELLAALSIFDGTITQDLAQKLFQGHCMEDFDEIVNADLILTTEDEIKVKHVLYLDYINRMEFIGNACLQSLALRIRENLNATVLNEDTKMIVVIKTSDILNDTIAVAQLSYDFSVKLYKKGQYYLSYQYIQKAYENLPASSYDTSTVFFKVKILENLIQTSFYLKGKSCESLRDFTNELRSLITLYQLDFEGIAEYPHVMLQAYMILSRYVHTLGLFEEELDYIKQAETFISKNMEICDDALISNVMVEHAITIKERDGLNGYVCFLEQKVREYPNSKDLEYTLNSAMYQKLVITKPKEAMIYLEKNLMIEAYMAIPEKYHNKVHIASAYLYSKNYDKAMGYSLKLLKETEQAGLKNESGRIGNILGCVYLVQNNEEKARQYFEYSMSIYRNNNYVSYLWPILVNYITLNFQYKKDKEVLKTMKDCIDIFQKYKNRINNLNLQEIPFEKIYVALLLLIHYLKEYQYKKDYQEEVMVLLDSLIKEITLPQILEFATGTGRLPDRLKETSYFHEGSILLGY